MLMLMIYVYYKVPNHMEKFLYKHLALLYYESGPLFHLRKKDRASILCLLQLVLNISDDLEKKLLNDSNLKRFVKRKFLGAESDRTIFKMYLIRWGQSSNF